MSDTIILAWVAIGFPISFRLVFRAWVRDFSDNGHLEWGCFGVGFVISLFLGACLALAGPLVWVYAALRGRTTNAYGLATLLAGESPCARAARLNALNATNERLERDIGI